MQPIGLISALSVGATLLISGASKLGDLEVAGYMVQNLGLLPKQIGRLAGQALPIVELMTGAALLLGWQVRAAVALSALLTLAFVVANVKGILQEADFACYCFGPWIGGRLGWGGLGHSLLLLLLSVLAGAWPSPSVFVIAKTASWTEWLLIALPVISLVQVGMVIKMADLK